MRDQLDRLAADVQAANLSRTDFEALVLRLSPQERRLFLRLARGPAMTTELRQACSVGNISQVRSSLNAKLEQAGDPRRVLWCRRCGPVLTIGYQQRRRQVDLVIWRPIQFEALLTLVWVGFGRGAL